MKDPAFLFYPNDYLGGTMGMTFEQKGAYIELLMTQFNRGHMTIHIIGQVLGQNGGQIWDVLKDKFIKDSDGKYYNERLEAEQIKRKTFTESRKNNLSGKNQYTKKQGHKTKHMTSHMENRDRDENIIEIVYPFSSENFKTLWGYWKEYKLKEHKFKYKTPLSEQAALKSLGELSGQNEETALKIIEQSIGNGWQGFFELKDNKHGNKQGIDGQNTMQNIIADRDRRRKETIADSQEH